MGLTDDQKRECREIADVVAERVLEHHTASCPHGKALEIFKARLVGACIAAAVLSGGTVFGLAKLFGG